MDDIHIYNRLFFEVHSVHTPMPLRLIIRATPVISVRTNPLVYTFCVPLYQVSCFIEEVLFREKGGLTLALEVVEVSGIGTGYFRGRLVDGESTARAVELRGRCDRNFGAIADSNLCVNSLSGCAIRSLYTPTLGSRLGYVGTMLLQRPRRAFQLIALVLLCDN